MVLLFLSLVIMEMNSTMDKIISTMPIEVDVVGVSAIAVFYLLMVLVGGWATWNHYRKNSHHATSNSEELLLAGRRLGFLMAAASLSATQVGGAFLSGTAEEVYKNGILWCCVPFAYISGMIINGLIFAKIMRQRGYVTVFDPIQENFGQVMGGLCLVPHIIGDLFWIGAVLSVLGTTLTVSMGLRKEISVLISSAVGIIYTMSGGMWSVAYTDVLQLIIVAFGLFLSLPYILTSEAVSKGGYGETKDWLGSISSNQTGTYVDAILVPLLGGIPWQGYYQRVLSLKSAEQALPMTLLASVPSLILLIPPIIIGGIAKTAAWNETELGTEIGLEDASLVLPLSLRYLVPSAVSFVGVGAVTAAVISTMDSSVLGASSAIANNIYKGLFRKKASDSEIVWCTRMCVLGVGIAATGVAFAAESIYGLWYLSSDLTYLLTFPHFVMAMTAPGLGTTLGSASSFVVGIILRILSGERSMGLIPIIEFPETVPVRTLTMIISAAVLLLVSILERFLRSKLGWLGDYSIENEVKVSNHFNLEVRDSKQNNKHN